MRYYISDNHFYHERLNTNMDKRGFASVKDMNDYMIAQWNKKVRKNDDVVILGDLSVGKAVETNAILEKLNGRLFMICGNHDKWIKQNGANLSRFQWIKDYVELNDNGRKVICCHYPIMCYNGQFRRNKNGEPKTYMLYGHVHRTQDLCGIYNYIDYVKEFPRASRLNEKAVPAPIQMINCFCMYSDYMPLTLDEWIDVEKSGIARQSIQADWKYDK